MKKSRSELENTISNLTVWVVLLGFFFVILGICFIIQVHQDNLLQSENSQLKDKLGSVNPTWTITIHCVDEKNIRETIESDYINYTKYKDMLEFTKQNIDFLTSKGQKCEVSP